MKLEINLTIDNLCGVHLLDTTQYLSEPGEGYMKSDVYTVTVVRKYNSDAHQVYIYSPIQDFKIDSIEDGAYDILVMLIPNITITTNKSINYYTDGLQFFKDKEIVSIEEIIEVNKDITNIISTNITPSFTCNLKNCYINLCKNLNLDKCYTSEDTFNRDLVWMTLNIIDYLTEFGQLDEVNELITLINGCNGICKSTNRGAIINQCGCS